MATCTEVTAIAFATNTIRRSASQYGTNLNGIVVLNNLISQFRCDFFVQWNDNFTRILVNQFFCRETTYNTVFQWFDDTSTFNNSFHFNAVNFIVVNLYFFRIRCQDGFDAFLCQFSMSRENFYPLRIHNWSHCILVEHVVDHGLFQRCSDGIIGFT